MIIGKYVWAIYNNVNDTSETQRTKNKNLESYYNSF
jgi:hypothetical protein